MELNLNKERTEEKGKLSCKALLESGDLPAERVPLLAQMQVLDCILQQVENEEQQRAITEGSLIKYASANDTTPSFTHLSDGDNFKRRRRPNPKYFVKEADFPTTRSSPSVTFCLYGEKLSASLGFLDGHLLQIAGIAEEVAIAPSVGPHATLTSFFDCCMVCPAATCCTLTELAQKPRLVSTSKVTVGSAAIANTSDIYLDSLSIRELHEAFKNTFGRDTAVKDKHWLKRQIFMGSSKPCGNVEYIGNPALAKTSGKRGRKYFVHAPLYGCGSTDVNGEIKRGLGTPASLLCCSLSTETKRSCKTLSHAVLVPSGLSTLSSSLGCQTNTGACTKKVNPDDGQNSESPMSRKRLRKPNRRYIEDGGDYNISQPASSRLSWSNEIDLLGNWKRSGALRSIRASTRSPSCHGGQSRSGLVMKRRDLGQAKNILELAHSSQAGQHDANSKVQKVKFRLPAAPGQEKDMLIGGNEEQVLCMLPVFTKQFSEDYHMLCSRHPSRSETNNEQAAVTFPTAMSGTRRKHHRPWTIQEVVTLIEGVAQCGGGKWAEIKKLGFSAVTYRTAVDLKDKWRNLLRASQAQLLKGATRKKQFSASVPDHILARVRELAALNNPITSTMNTGNSFSRIGQTVHRRLS